MQILTTQQYIDSTNKYETCPLINNENVQKFYPGEQMELSHTW